MLIHDWTAQPHITRGRPVLSAAEAIGLLPGPGHLFLGSGAAAPYALLQALCDQCDRLGGSTLHHIILLADPAFGDPRFTAAFRHQSYFLGIRERPLVEAGDADAVPIFFHELGRAFRTQVIPLDGALVQVSPPDAHGRFSYGTAVDFVKPAVESARMVIAEVNPQQPYVHGNASLTAEQVTA
ncbi:MAG TPA: hypothetical protein VEI97_13540, partial [bacterium]|nr:hypothetical protein [bacterium]